MTPFKPTGAVCPVSKMGHRLDLGGRCCDCFVHVGVLVAPPAAVEVAPGVFIDAEGRASGPGLEAALACYADVLAIAEWFSDDPFWKNALLRRVSNAPVSEVHLRRAAYDGPENKFAAADLPAALRLAADAIRNGKMKP